MLVWKLDGNEEELADKAAQAPVKGEVIACPTDTVYGLLADAGSKAAVNKVYEIKGREKGRPLPVFVGSVEQAKELAFVNERQEKFLQEAWPGSVTAVLGSRKGGTVGLRVPDHSLVQLILKKAGRPLTGTSANKAGEETARSARELLGLQGVWAVVDGGELVGRPSRVVDITGEQPVVLRAP